MNPAEVWGRIRKLRPLILTLTNGVSRSDQAQITLAAGASPIMSLCSDEMEDLLTRADAVLINTGTPEADFLRAVDAVLTLRPRVPLVLDPVGCGASRFRGDLVRRCLDSGLVSILKGNAAELGFLAGTGGTLRGVDSAEEGNPGEAVRRIARETRCVAVATGCRDRLSDGTREREVRGGDALAARVSGSGCCLGSLAAACAAVAEDPLEAALTACAAFRLAARRAGMPAAGPGRFRGALLDELADLAEADLKPENLQREGILP
jgi:hydroxyethylthiazole kinase